MRKLLNCVGFIPFTIYLFTVVFVMIEPIWILETITLFILFVGGYLVRKNNTQGPIIMLLLGLYLLAMGLFHPLKGLFEESLGSALILYSTILYAYLFIKNTRLKQSLTL